MKRAGERAAVNALPRTRCFRLLENALLRTRRRERSAESARLRTRFAAAQNALFFSIPLAHTTLPFHPADRQHPPPTPLPQQLPACRVHDREGGKRGPRVVRGRLIEPGPRVSTCKSDANIAEPTGGDKRLAAASQETSSKRAALSAVFQSERPASGHPRLLHSVCGRMCGRVSVLTLTPPRRRSSQSIFCLTRLSRSNCPPRLELSRFPWPAA